MRGRDIMRLIMAAIFLVGLTTVGVMVLATGCTPSPQQADVTAPVTAPVGCKHASQDSLTIFHQHNGRWIAYDGTKWVELWIVDSHMVPQFVRDAHKACVLDTVSADGGPKVKIGGLKDTKKKRKQ